VALSKYAKSGATSLPKVFIGGKCIGGCAELSSAVESGEFDELVEKVGDRGGTRQRLKSTGTSKEAALYTSSLDLSCVLL
jgi:hypothetical protein